MQDHESSVDVLESWGPWQPVMEEAITGCMIQLRKLDVLLRDGGLGSVDEFYTDAMQLYHLANELAERCEDIMRWRSVRSGVEAGGRDEG
jgi:hypothetical protein